MLINIEVQTWKEAYLKVNPLKYCFCLRYKLWYFQTTQSHERIITELYTASSVVFKICGEKYMGGDSDPLLWKWTPSLFAQLYLREALSGEIF